MKFLGKTKVFTYLFYGLAILYLLYTIFQAVSTVGYLSEVASSGMYVDVGFSDMLTAFVGTVGPNLFYTAVLFFCGYAVQLIAGDVIPEDGDFEESYNASKPATAAPVESAVKPAIQEQPSGTSDETENDLGSSSVDDFVSTIADIETETQGERDFYDEAQSYSTPEAHQDNYAEDYDPDSNVEGKLKENQDYEQNEDGEIVVEEAIELPDIDE